MAKRLKGSLKNIQFQLSVPGDKSISHRAIIMGSIAEGMTKVTGFFKIRGLFKYTSNNATTWRGN